MDEALNMTMPVVMAWRSAVESAAKQLVVDLETGDAVAAATEEGRLPSFDVLVDVVQRYQAVRSATRF